MIAISLRIRIWSIRAVLFVLLMCGSCGVYYMERANGFIYSHHTTLPATREFVFQLFLKFIAFSY